MKLLLDRHEASGVIAGFTFGTFFLDKLGELTFFPLDCINRTGFQAGTAFYALFRDYLPEEQLLAAV